MSGSYNNYFHIYDQNAQQDIVLQADKSAFKAKKIGQNKQQKAGAAGAAGGANGKKGASATTKPIIDTENIDFNKKILHGQWQFRSSTCPLSTSCSSTHAHSCFCWFVTKFL